LNQMAPKPETQFIRACSTGKSELVRELLLGGLSPDTRDTYGLTGLIWAGRKGQVAVAEVLLAGGADLEAKDRRGRTALHHAVAFKRLDFVELIANRGVFLSPVDMHGCTPLDLASWPVDSKMVSLLKQLGAERKKSQEPPEKRRGLNRFASGGASGGPDLPIEVERVRVQLNTLLHHWTGEYSTAVEGFSFPLFVDGSLVRYTEQMNLLGPQKPRRSGTWLMVKIGVPESWWRDNETAYKTHLTDSIEEGFNSMIALLQRNKHEVNAERLLADWAAVKREFLKTTAPPFPAEKQRESMMAMVNEARRAVEARKSPK
jgi:Ankyrin repeats (many copies)